MGRSRKHPVRLGPGEAEELARRAKDPSTPATVRDRCLVLRELDEARAPRLTMAEVAERNRVSRTTVSECARRYAEGGLEGALSMARSANSDNARRKVDGRAEARIIATACGAAPGSGASSANDGIAHASAATPNNGSVFLFMGGWGWFSKGRARRDPAEGTAWIVARLVPEFNRNRIREYPRNPGETPGLSRLLPYAVPCPAAYRGMRLRGGGFRA